MIHIIIIYNQVGINNYFYFNLYIKFLLIYYRYHMSNANTAHNWKKYHTQNDKNSSRGESYT